MKNLFSLLVLCCIVFIASAQNNIVNLKKKDIHFLQDGYHPANPVPFNQTHLYLKNQLHQMAQDGASRNVTTVELGSAGNLFTILTGEVNRIASNNVLNTVTFIHRSDPTVFPSSNKGQYRYDVSYDGGGTWELNYGVLNPKGNQQTKAGRYPNCAIYNPVGNTNTNSAYMAYLGSWLPFDAGGSWDGHFAGVARLDNDTTTFTENIYTPANGDINIVAGMCNGAQGTFWAVNWENSSNTTFDPTAILVFKGIWNPNKDDVDWVQHDRIIPAWDLDFDGTAQAAAINISFDPTGQFGWIAILGDVTPGGDNVLAPVFYKTSDGGNTWSSAIPIDLGTFNNIVNLDPIPETGFDMDLVVDVNGNPHMLVVVATLTGDYAVPSTGTKHIYDVTYVPSGANDCKWQAIFIDDIATFRGDITTNVSEDNRPQCAISPDGQKVFFGWLDSDPAVTGGTNALPNFKTRALDVNTGKATSVVNWTATDPVWAGGALFASTAPIALHFSNTYKVPTVFTELNSSGSDEDPTYFHYAQNVQYSESDFTVDVFPPVINLNGNSPVTVVVNTPYTDDGAVAYDNADGDITSNIIVNTSNVNVAVPGSYVVTYNVTDGAGNIACDATRIVNVVSSADNTPPTLTINGPSTINVDVCDFFADPGATATDNVDGDITDNIVVNSTVPYPLTPDTFTIDYDVTDGAGNAAPTQSRTVIVSDLPPTITLNGDSVVNVELCQPFVDEGALAVDNCAGALAVTVTGSVGTTVGPYTLTYTATDGVNAPVSVTRTVNITPDITPPDLIIIGASPYYVYLGTSFTDPGAGASDCADGNLTSSITSNASAVNVSSRGNYTVTYTVSDAAGNSETATRVVVVNTEPDPDFDFKFRGGTVDFSDSSLYNPTGWAWDFGDQGANTQRSPSHTYAQNGTYHVCLKASNIYNSAPFNKAIKEICKDVVVTAVGINDIAIDNSFDIYPNPTSGLLTIAVKSSEFEKVSIRLFDLVGKEVKTLELNQRTAGSMQSIDLSGNAEGVYLVKIQTEKGTATKKIIVSR